MSAATRRLEIGPELCSGFIRASPKACGEHDPENGSVLSCWIVLRSKRYGAIAQLGERLHGMQEVGGSIPPGSTSLRSLRELWLGKPGKSIGAKRAKAAASWPEGRRRAKAQANAVKQVYILESLDSGHFYAGITNDPNARLAKHNAGKSRTFRSTSRGELEPILPSVTRGGRSLSRNT